MAQTTQPVQVEPVVTQPVTAQNPVVGQVQQNPVAGQQPVKKKSKWWLWVIIGVVVVAAGILAYLKLF